MNILIVEDEKLARESLCNLNWSSIDITVTDACENGLKALESAKKLKPDIIISDIKMPEISGLELAKNITTISPDTKVILLTAYNDFKYAQQAISYGVFEYILKPYSEEQLLECVKKAKKEIEIQNEKNETAEKAIEQFEFSKYFMKNYFFESIDDDSIFYDFFENDKFVSVFIQLKTSNYKVSYKMFCDILKIINKKTSDYTAFFEITSFSFIFGFNKNQSSGNIDQFMQDITNDMHKYLTFSTDMDFVIGVGDVVNSRKTIKSSYNSAINATKYCFYLGQKTIIFISDLETSSSSYNYQLKNNDSFYNSIKIGDINTAEKDIHELFDNFIANHVNITTVQNICHNIITNLAICLIECNLNPNILFNETDVSNLIKHYTDINLLEKYILDIVQAIIAYIEHGRTKKNTQLIQNIKKYVHENPAVSVNELGEYFQLSSNYISAIFNSGTTSIKNYIISERIQRAKYLLRNTNKTIYEISFEVGYKKAQHFSTVFKKFTNLTPSDYREYK